MVDGMPSRWKCCDARHGADIVGAELLAIYDVALFERETLGGAVSGMCWRKMRFTPGVGPQ